MQQLLGDEPSEVEDDSEDDIKGVMTGDPKESRQRESER